MASHSKLTSALVALGVAGLAIQACADRAAPTAVDQIPALDEKPNGQFNEKFTFDPVTFPDGTTGVIYAGSKRTGGGSETTHCEYHSGGNYLGAFNTNDFASPDADVIRQFCLDHFDDRT